MIELINLMNSDSLLKDIEVPNIAIDKPIMAINVDIIKLNWDS